VRNGFRTASVCKKTKRHAYVMGHKALHTIDRSHSDLLISQYIILTVITDAETSAAIMAITRMLDTIHSLAYMWYSISETESVSVITCKDGKNPIELSSFQRAKIMSMDFSSLTTEDGNGSIVWKNVIIKYTWDNVLIIVNGQCVWYDTSVSQKSA
jgi:hypothetical protein